MGACGSKQQLQEQFQETASKLQAAAGSAWGDLSELAAAYNPLESKGDPNSRCCLMLKQAVELTAKVKKTQKEWKEFTTEAKGALDSSRAALESPMPTVFTASLREGEQPTVNPELLGGQGFKGDAIETIKAKLEADLQAGVYDKMDQWVANLKDLAQKQRALNKLWADVEAKRKALTLQQQEIEKLRAQAAAGDHKSAGKVPEAERVLAEKDAALKAATAAHDAAEAPQYEQLKATLEQAPSLRTHITTALDAVAAAMNATKAAMTAPAAASFKLPAAVPAAVPAAPAAVPAAVPTEVAPTAPDSFKVPEAAVPLSTPAPAPSEL